MQGSDKQEKQTFVEEGTELRGTLTSTCPVVINGSVDGQIDAPALTVTSSGTMLGNIKAKELRSEGTLAGNIDADQVYLSGVVRSDTVIRASSLEVKLDAEQGKLEVTFGECKLEVGDDPSLRAKSPKSKPEPLESETNNGSEARTSWAPPSGGTA